MLSGTRRKLTIVYTMVFGLFLLVFTGMVCFILIWGTYVERTEEIKVLANEVAREQLDLIIEQHKKEKSVPQEILAEDDYDISGQVFYYIVDSKRQLVKYDPPVSILRNVVYEQIKKWDSLRDTKIIAVRLPTGEMAALALAAHEVHYQEEFLATVYVGRDVTAYARSLMRSVITLTASAFLFIILAAICGYFLAGKVTIPMEESIKRKKQFIADASHELRTPLSVLLTSMEAIEMDKDTLLSPFAVQIMQDAKDEFFRLKKLVNNLLTLARTDTGEIKLRKEIFPINLVVEQVLHSLKTAAEQKAITIVVMMSEYIEVNADPERIHQLLYILVDNGLKYSSPQSQLEINIECIEKNMVPHIKIIVADRGRGIPLKFQKQIFQRFFRIDESRSRTTEGSGLGLSIAQWIVTAHQGEIFVQSELNQGSEFIVIIPCT